MRRLIVVAAAVLFLPAVRAAAQDLANIVGTVTDQSGAVVPGVNLTISNPDRGFTRRVASDSAGEYTTARVPIGNYVITVEKPGFQKLVRSGLSLQVGQTLRVDLELQVGSATQEVVVNASAAKVDTESGAISDVVTGSQVSQLNLNARNFANLATLVPGAATLGTGFDTSHVGVLANAAISFNGLPVNVENWEVDSTNNIDQGSGSGSIMTYPSVDSIAEFRVSTSNYSAEYGKSGGANIEVVTKSGTKDFHGDLFEFVRNDKFDANDWFINRQITADGSSAPQTPLKRNNWGFTLGGPVYIPGHYNHDRNKTFFFVSEEWRENREGTVIDSQVPTLGMRQGDFSECDPGSPNYNVVAASGCKLPTNPDTGTLFPNNLVPVSPTAKALLDGLVPLPNNGIDRYTAAPSLPTSFREDMFKIDQNITDNIRVFFRYTQDAFESDYIPTLWSNANFGTVKSLWQSPAKSAVLHLTQTIRPDLLNEFIASFSADVNKVNNFTGFDSPAGSISKPSGFDAKTIFPANQSIEKLPSIAIGGGVPFSFGESTGFEFFFWDPQIAFKDNLVWTKGSHTLKAGAFLLRNNINTTTNIGLSPQGSYTFSDSSSLSTGNALADMFLGRIASYEEYGRTVDGQLLGGSALGHWRQWDFEPYFQDDWRVNSRLTLNLGVRYYWLSPFYDVVRPTNDSLFIPSQYNPANEAKLDINGNFIPGTGATPLNYGNGLVECGTGSIPRGCYHSFRGTVSPRFGFAFDPFGNGTTAIRGGYALTWDGGNPLHNGAGFNGNPPAAADLFSYNIAGFNNVGPGPIPPSSFSNVNLGKWQEIQQFNFGIQHQFPGNNILSVSYVGTLGRHLQQNVNIDQVRVGSGVQNVPALAGTSGCDAQGNCNVQDILMNYNFKQYWSSVLQLRPLWGPEDFYFLRNWYRIGFQKVEVEDNTSAVKHVSAWQTAPVIYFLMQQVYVESKYRDFDILALVKKYLKVKNPTYLEYGSGIGPITQLFSDFDPKFEKAKFLIADIKTAAFHYGQKRFESFSNVRSYPLEETNDLQLDESVKKADCIFCITVFEHLNAPLNTINRFYELLPPGGLLFFDYIKGEGTGLDTAAGVREREAVLSFVKEKFEIIQTPGRHIDNSKSLGLTLVRKK